MAQVTRRGFIKAAASAAIAFAVPQVAGAPAVSAPASLTKVGFVSVTTHPELVERTTVFLDGKKLEGCYAADDVRGMAWCFTYKTFAAYEYPAYGDRGGRMITVPAVTKMVWSVYRGKHLVRDTTEWLPGPEERAEPKVTALKGDVRIVLAEAKA